MAYATETNRDFDLKFMKNPISNDVVIKIDRPERNRFPAIEQSITNILMTSKLERKVYACIWWKCIENFI